MEATPLSPAKLRILIADDHEVLRRGLLELIEQHPGWHVIGEASNGREAVRLALKTMPNVVVLDLLMPEMNGLEATRVIKKELPNTEVLIFTLHDSEDLIRHVLAAGARGYLLKTELAHHVVAAIESVGEHKPFFSWQISQKLLDNYVAARAAGAPSTDLLTTAEREVMQLLAEGRRNNAISASLGINVKTVEMHRAAMMKKLEAKSLADMVRYAVRAKVIAP